jgi:hypothetical protein
MNDDDELASLRAERAQLAEECAGLRKAREDDRLLIESALALKKASAKLNADIESLRTEVAQLKQRRFPIQDGPSVPWSLVVPYEGQAFTNHDQSLERLAQRGGLGVGELWCVVHGKRWREASSKAVAEAWLRGWLHEHESAAAERDALRVKLEAEREFAVQLVKNELTLRKRAEDERDEALTSLKAPEVHWDCQQKIDSLEDERDQVHVRLTQACVIADEWIDLGIPDDDAIEAKGKIADLRKAAGITITEEKS